jgi:hypothetical protein
MSVGAAPKAGIPVTAEQKPAVEKLAGTAKVAALGFFLLGVVQIVMGPLGWFTLDTSFLSALLMLVTGAVCVLMGLVLLSVSTDFKYLTQYPQFSGNHFRNAAKALTFLCQFLTALVVLIGLAALIRYWS